MGDLNEDATVVESDDFSLPSIEEILGENQNLRKYREDRFIVVGSCQLIKSTLREVCDQIDAVLQTEKGTAWNSISGVMKARKGEDDAGYRIWEMVVDEGGGVRVRKTPTSRHSSSQTLVWPVIKERVRVAEKGADGKAKAPAHCCTGACFGVSLASARTVLLRVFARVCSDYKAHFARHVNLLTTMSRASVTIFCNVSSV